MSVQRICACSSYGGSSTGKEHVNSLLTSNSNQSGGNHCSNDDGSDNTSSKTCSRCLIVSQQACHPLLVGNDLPVSSLLLRASSRGVVAITFEAIVILRGASSGDGNATSDFIANSDLAPISRSGAYQRSDNASVSCIASDNDSANSWSLAADVCVVTSSRDVANLRRSIAEIVGANGIVIAGVRKIGVIANEAGVFRAYTGVKGARILVIAVYQRWSNTKSSAGVTERWGASSAVAVNGRVNALSGSGVTRVNSAQVSRRAVHGLGHASSIQANDGVASSTCTGANEGIRASAIGANIKSARVSIGTVWKGAGYAHAGLADRRVAERIRRIANNGVEVARKCGASRDARVGGTFVRIVTSNVVEHATSNRGIARVRVARVDCRACNGCVDAGRCFRRSGASDRTVIQCASIEVVAGDRISHALVVNASLGVAGVRVIAIHITASTALQRSSNDRVNAQIVNASRSSAIQGSRAVLSSVYTT